jgi:hypothetical protein
MHLLPLLIALMLLNLSSAISGDKIPYDPPSIHQLDIETTAKVSFIEDSFKKAGEPELAISLEKSQSAWLAYRDAQVTLEEQLASNSETKLKIRFSVYLHMTLERSKYLDEILKKQKAEQGAAANP